MPVEIDTELVRRNNGNFPITDDANIRGSLHIVDTIATRNAIQSNLLKVGMLVRVQTDGPAPGNIYQLMSTGPSVWAVFIGGGGGGITSISGGFGITLTPDPIIATGTVAINQAMVPTWTGTHTFINPIAFGAGNAAVISGAAGALTVTGGFVGAIGSSVAITTGSGAASSGNFSIQLGAGAAAGTLNIGTSAAVSVLAIGSALVTSATYRGATTLVEATSGPLILNAASGTTSILASGITHITATGISPHLTIGPSNNIEISIVSPILNGLQFVQGAVATILVRQSTTLGAAGAQLTISPGQGAHGAGATPGAGGGLLISSGGTGGNGTAVAVAGPGGQYTGVGGNAGANLGGGGGAGGPAVIDGGTGTGAAAHGVVFIGISVAPSVTIGRIGGSSTTHIVASETRLTPLSLAAIHPPNDILLQSPAHTTLAATSEHTPILFSLSSALNFNAGAIVTQRHVRFTQPLYSFVAASTITNAATVAIANAPAAGVNATITNAYALWIEAGTTLLGGTLSHTGAAAGYFGAPPIAQPSSTGETAGFTAGTGTGVNDDSTFTGNVGTKAYTLGDVVKHLKNLGHLAAS